MDQPNQSLLWFIIQNLKIETQLLLGYLVVRLREVSFTALKICFTFLWLMKIMKKKFKLS